MIWLAVETTVMTNQIVAEIGRNPSIYIGCHAAAVWPRTNSKQSLQRKNLLFLYDFKGSVCLDRKVRKYRNRDGQDHHEACVGQEQCRLVPLRAGIKCPPKAWWNLRNKNKVRVNFTVPPKELNLSLRKLSSEYCSYCTSVFIVA